MTSLNDATVLVTDPDAVDRIAAQAGDMTCSARSG
jgi:hypothetical protein